MIKSVKQVRAAISLLNPASVRERAERRVDLGLVASTPGGYAEMEDFLLPPALPRSIQLQLMQTLHRAGDPGASDQVDLVLYEQGLPTPHGAYTFYRDDPQRTIEEILHDNEDLSLALARQYPALRQAVVNRIVQAVSWENALFAVAT